MSLIYGNTVRCPRCDSSLFYYAQSAKLYSLIQCINLEKGYCQYTDAIKTDYRNDHALCCEECGWKGSEEDYGKLLKEKS